MQKESHEFQVLQDDRSILKCLSLNMAIINQDGIIEVVNKQWRKFALDNPPVKGNVNEGANYLEVCDNATGEDAGLARQAAAGIRDVLAGKNASFYLEYPCHSPDKLRWFAVRVTLLQGHKTKRVIVLHENITERKQVELQLQESETKFRTLTTHSPTGVYLTDAEGKCIYANDKWCEMAGLTAEEALGDGWAKGLYSEDREHIAELWQQMIRNNSHWGTEYRFQNQEGKIIWVYGYAAAINNKNGDTIGYVGSNVDITRRKLSEQALIESQQRFQAAANYTYDWETWFNPTGGVEWINSAVERMTGYTIQECLGMKDYPLPIVFDEDRELMTDILRQGLAGDSGNDKPFRIDCKDGSICWGAISWQRVYDNQGASLGLRTSVRDITERKKMEEQLKFNRRILNQTGKMAKIGGWEHDLRTNTAVWTESLYEIIGIPYGHPIPGPDEHLDFYPEKEREVLGQAYHKAMEENVPFDLELQVNTVGGNCIWVRVYGEPVLENGKCIKMRGTFQDISERKATEDILNKDHEQLRLLSIKLSSTEEQERRRIAEDIHDHLIQPLVFLDIKIKSMLDTAKDNAMRDSFKQIRTTLTDLINKSRTVTFDFGFPTLYELGLCSAIEEWLQSEVKEKYDLQFTFFNNLKIQDKNLNHEMSLFLFKSLRELSINVVKHAKASEVPAINQSVRILSPNMRLNHTQVGPFESMGIPQSEQPPRRPTGI